MTKFLKISENQYNKDMKGCTFDTNYDDIKLPKRATNGSAGYDIYSPFSFVLTPKSSIKIPTGIKVELEKDQVLLIAPRSGYGVKYRLQLDNTVGVIDSDYIMSDNEGHIWLKLTNDTNEEKTIGIKKGDAIAQGIILRFDLTEDDYTDAKRNGGFGSTTTI